ncbi:MULTISPECIES: glycerate kinase [Paenarthrobacter]|uniref:Glycerate kinase n=1 Tax=Paenarthrobacter ureafaciens TaxID=37931 RepID=A0AAX3EGC1_PAEUR|nr:MULTISPECIES: glycerate kinase [Paenarthrobacter]NKR14129.1 glycerate kinase [Arthrobacter sp. M5]NKR17869.1 glycerate kinase [Arthrobacter sp. M6]OEH56843.1 glycerate kinase [Arthrobacter sp. D4]OEH63899.1 glycerate kinase [Arthrobacter sp. D2]MDO5866212.1 glycerate kinase [Paenarthrobacter sp. SD-2]
MRVVIAPDKFKGSLSAPDVAEHLATGLLAGYGHNGFEATRIPVADGGEGTIDAAIGSGFTRRTTTVTGPLGEPVKADFAVRDQEAVIEMAAASGLALLPDGPTSETAKTATSIGTGELIRAALDLGCRKIILGVGGSANTDAGAGVLQGLGAVFLDENGNELPGGGAALAQLNSIDFSNFDVRVEATEFVLASDVDNPLLGASGAPAIFGPQKGATPDDVTSLDAALSHFVDVLAATTGQHAKYAAKAEGAGAAGGVGYIAIAALKAERRPGIDVVLEFTELENKLKGADLVITGEGSLDEQSLLGKTPMGVSRAAAKAGIPVIAVCGRTTLSAEQLTNAGFHTVHALTHMENNVQKCIAEAGPLLEQLGKHIGVYVAERTGNPDNKEYLNV